MWLHDQRSYRLGTLTHPEGIMTTAATTTEEFAGHVLSVFDNAAAALMASIGHQTGLFDTMKDLPPSSAREIADAAGLNERYVREWLDAMTVARFVEYDPRSHAYVLPFDHAASLTRDAGPGNLAVMMPFIAMLAEVEQPIIECFRQGGGLPYEAYERFHEIMAANSAAAADTALIDIALPLADGLPDRLRGGIDVLDLGCGRGHAINVMARAFPNSRFTGYDFSADAIESARREVVEWEVTNARFDVVDVARIDEIDAYDLITAFDAIHDQAEPAEVLRRAARALRPGGTFLMVDFDASSNVEENFDIPWATFMYTVSTMHCMSVSLGLGGAGLGTAWGRQLAEKMLHEAGFADVDVQSIEQDPLNNYYIARL